MPAWRNWHTQQVEGLCRKAWRFESSRGHHLHSGASIKKRRFFIPYNAVSVFSIQGWGQAAQRLHCHCRLRFYATDPLKKNHESACKSMLKPKWNV